MSKRTWQLCFEQTLMSEPAGPAAVPELERSDLMACIQRLELAPGIEQRITLSILSAVGKAGNTAAELGQRLPVIVRILIRRNGGAESGPEDAYRLHHPEESQRIDAKHAIPTISLSGSLPSREGQAGGGYFLVERLAPSLAGQPGSPYYLIELYFYFAGD